MRNSKSRNLQITPKQHPQKRNPKHPQTNPNPAIAAQTHSRALRACGSQRAPRRFRWYGLSRGGKMSGRTTPPGNLIGGRCTRAPLRNPRKFTQRYQSSPKRTPRGQAPTQPRPQLPPRPPRPTRPPRPPRPRGHRHLNRRSNEQTRKSRRVTEIYQMMNCCRSLTEGHWGVE